MKMQTKFGGNGVLPLHLGWAGAFHNVEIIGGPFDNFPGRAQAFGVCVRAEQVPDAFDVHLAIRDFSVPQDRAAVEQALTDAFDAAIDGNQVYVGCMGGWGRTGLFLALMAKAAGIEKPVEYVRANYSPKAVETQEQYIYVRNFDTSTVRRRFRNFAWRKRLAFLARIIR